MLWSADSRECDRLGGELVGIGSAQFVERDARRDRQDPGRQLGATDRIELGQRADDPHERLLREVRRAVLGAAGEQAPHERVDAILIERDQIAPRPLLTALSTAQRELVELRRGGRGRERVHAYPLSPATPEKVPSYFVNAYRIDTGDSPAGNCR